MHKTRICSRTPRAEGCSPFSQDVPTCTLSWGASSPEHVSLLAGGKIVIRPLSFPVSINPSAYVSDTFLVQQDASRQDAQILMLKALSHLDVGLSPSTLKRHGRKTHHDFLPQDKTESTADSFVTHLLHCTGANFRDVHVQANVRP